MENQKETIEKSNNTSRKGTANYMIIVTTLFGLLGGLGWYSLGFEAGVFTLLLAIILLLSAIRYNQ